MLMHQMSPAAHFFRRSAIEFITAIFYPHQMTIAAFYLMPPKCFGDLPVMSFFGIFTVPQFDTAGQATSRVKTDDALTAKIQFTAIKIDLIGWTK